MSVPQTRESNSRRHPLQRFESPSRGFSGLIHATGLVNFFLAFKWLVDHPNRISESYGWHLQYLTILGLLISTICFASGLLADIQIPKSMSRTLFKTKNYLALVAAPIEIVISVLYWGLRLISPSLVIPPDMPVLPLLNDFTFHLLPSVFLAIDALLLSPPWPTTPLPPHASIISLVTATLISFVYWFWIELCYSKNGWYPYPIFELLSTGQRVGLFAGSGVIMWAAGAGLRMAYVGLNGYEEAESEKKRE